MRNGSMIVRKGMAVMLPLVCEERPQQRAALVLLHPSDHLHLMIHAAVPRHVAPGRRLPGLLERRRHADLVVGGGGARPRPPSLVPLPGLLMHARARVLPRQRARR